jgi:hypothetical protein
MRIDITGIDELERNLRLLLTQAGRALEAALWTEGLEIGNASQRVVPRRYGVLAGSIVVGRPERRADTIRVRVGYGGAASAYAAYIHEGQESWNWNIAGTGPKYLERPAREAASGMGRRLAARIGRGLR